MAEPPDPTDDWLETLVEFAEENAWHFDDNPTATVECFSCGAEFPANRPWPYDGVADAGWREHKPDCELTRAIKKAQAFLEEWKARAK